MTLDFKNHSDTDIAEGIRKLSLAYIHEAGEDVSPEALESGVRTLRAYEAEAKKRSLVRRAGQARKEAARQAEMLAHGARAVYDKAGLVQKVVM